MHVFGINVVFLVVVSFWKLPDFAASDECSCYSFHGNSSSKQVGRQYCRDQMGDLVSIETTEEWSFIRNQFLNTTIEKNKEYWIGLEKEDGNWKWVNNHTEPPPTVKFRDTLSTDGKTHFTISYHSANSSLLLHAVANETISKGWICEYKNKNCSKNEEDRIVCKQVLVKTTFTSTTITTMNTYTTTIPTTTWMTSTTIPTTTPPPPPTTTTTTTATTTRPLTVVNTAASVNKTTAPPITNVTTKPQILTKPPTKMTSKVAKLTSAAPSTAAATASATERPFFIGILTTTSPVHECLSDPYLVVAISVSVIGGVTVLFFTALFLFVACRNKCSRPRRKVEKVEMEEGEYENHL